VFVIPNVEPSVSAAILYLDKLLFAQPCAIFSSLSEDYECNGDFTSTIYKKSGKALVGAPLPTWGMTGLHGIFFRRRSRKVG